MILFRQPGLEDKPAADAILNGLNYRSCDYTFGNIYIWRNMYQTQIAFEDGFLLIKVMLNGKLHYLFPVGEGNLKEMVRKLRDDAEKSGERFVFTAVTPEMQAALESLFPGELAFEPVRDAFDYIYRKDDLAFLAGKKFHSKRNHIARFEKLGEWAYERMDEGNLDECMAMNREWCLENGCGQDMSLRKEACAVRESFRHLRELGFAGGLLRLNGRVVGFSMGERLGMDTFNVHIEKAFYDVDGAYTMINREFVLHECENFAYVNREEDMGIEGLRKAKLSYNPSILLQKSNAFFKNA